MLFLIGLILIYHNKGKKSIANFRAATPCSSAMSSGSTTRLQRWRRTSCNMCGSASRRTEPAEGLPAAFIHPRQNRFPGIYRLADFSKISEEQTPLSGPFEARIAALHLRPEIGRLRYLGSVMGHSHCGLISLTLFVPPIMCLDARYRLHAACCKSAGQSTECLLDKTNKTGCQ